MSIRNSPFADHVRLAYSWASIAAVAFAPIFFGVVIYLAASR